MVIFDITYVGADLIGWGSKVAITTDLDVTRRLPENRMDACPQQAAGSWYQERPMRNEARNAPKYGGMTAAQTPSGAPAPVQIGTLAGAGTLAVTATNQSTRTVAGGGRCAYV